MQKVYKEFVYPRSKFDICTLVEFYDLTGLTLSNRGYKKSKLKYLLKSFREIVELIGLPPFWTPLPALNFSIETTLPFVFPMGVNDNDNDTIIVKYS